MPWLLSVPLAAQAYQTRSSTPCPLPSSHSGAGQVPRALPRRPLAGSVVELVLGATVDVRLDLVPLLAAGCAASSSDATAALWPRPAFLSALPRLFALPSVWSEDLRSPLFGGDASSTSPTAALLASSAPLLDEDFR